LEKLQLLSDQYNFSVTDPKGSAVLGRLETCQFRVPEVSISRQHCQFAFRAGGWYVCDLGSRHGTLLNGNQIQMARLEDGDELKMGDIILVVELGEPKPGAEAPAPVPAMQGKPEVSPTAVTQRRMKAPDLDEDLLVDELDGEQEEEFEEEQEPEEEFEEQAEEDLEEEPLEEGPAEEPSPRERRAGRRGKPERAPRPSRYGAKKPSPGRRRRSVEEEEPLELDELDEEEPLDQEEELDEQEEQDEQELPAEEDELEDDEDADREPADEEVEPDAEPEDEELEPEDEPEPEELEESDERDDEPVEEEQEEQEPEPDDQE